MTTMVRLGGVIQQNTLAPCKLITLQNISLSSFRVRIKSATGWWGKTARFVGTTSGVETVLSSAVYASNKPRIKTNNFTLSNSGWIDINNYDDVYIEFEIHDNAFQFDRHCKMRGCPNKLFASNIASNSDRFFINGRKQPNNRTIDFKATVNCGQRVERSWEDGGARSPDFYYYVEGKCDFINPKSVYLSH